MPVGTGCQGCDVGMGGAAGGGGPPPPRITGQSEERLLRGLGLWAGETGVYWQRMWPAAKAKAPGEAGDECGVRQERAQRNLSLQGRDGGDRAVREVGTGEGGRRMQGS